MTAVMLSAETATGAYPREAVSMMSRIVARVERDETYRAIMDAVHLAPERTAPDAISASAARVAETVRASAIVTFTTSGSTALRAARERPAVPLVALTALRTTARYLSIAWGVHCVVSPDVGGFAEMVEIACERSVEAGFAETGQRLVITAGVPFGTPGATNILHIAWIAR